jgi:hypothetical protein
LLLPFCLSFRAKRGTCFSREARPFFPAVIQSEAKDLRIGFCCCPCRCSCRCPCRCSCRRSSRCRCLFYRISRGLQPPEKPRTQNGL